jgi:hypothetical protein
MVVFLVTVFKNSESSREVIWCRRFFVVGDAVLSFSARAAVARRRTREIVSIV